MTKRTSGLLALGTAIVVVILVVVMILLIWNKDSNKTTSPSTAQTAANKQQIETNWKTFFAAETSLQNRQNLLQDGSQFTQAIQAEFTSLASQKSSAVINSISLTNSTTANVVYTVDLNGQPVLNNEKGSALLINKTWVVSDATLCQLLSMAGNTPTACNTTK